MNEFDGKVPEDRESLLRLPGVGSYTAAAIRSFAYGQREIVLDTNVRRLLTRLAWGVPTPVRHRPGGRGRWPRSWRPEPAARGALGRRLDGARCIGVPRSQSHLRCMSGQRPVCLASGGLSGLAGPPRHGQAYVGTDRQCRGALLACSDPSDGPVGPAEGSRPPGPTPSSASGR